MMLAHTAKTITLFGAPVAEEHSGSGKIQQRATGMSYVFSARLTTQ
jgi:hypothetical protein